VIAYQSKRSFTDASDPGHFVTLALAHGHFGTVC